MRPIFIIVLLFSMRIIADSDEYRPNIKIQLVHSELTGIGFLQVEQLINSQTPKDEWWKYFKKIQVFLMVTNNSKDELAVHALEYDSLAYDTVRVEFRMNDEIFENPLTNDELKILDLRLKKIAGVRALKQIRPGGSILIPVSLKDKMPPEVKNNLYINEIYFRVIYKLRNASQEKKSFVYNTEWKLLNSYLDNKKSDIQIKYLTNDFIDESFLIE